MNGHFSLDPQSVYCDVTRREFLKWTTAAAAAPWLLSAEARRASAFFQAPQKRTARAIVIGIDEYTAPKFGALKKPVEHAEQFTQWLLDAEVEDTNIILLTKRGVGPEPKTYKDKNKDGEVNCLEATFENLRDAIWDFAEKPGEESERLFFFFSGHGLRVESTGYETSGGISIVRQRDVVVLSNGQVLTLPSIQNLLATGNYAEQFYFIDACRNVADPAAGMTDLSAKHPQMSAKVRQLQLDPPRKEHCGTQGMKVRYVMNATQPTFTAPANSLATDKLLASLSQGVGNCLDRRDQKYQLRWNRLSAYLVEYFKNHPYREGEKLHYLQPDIFEEPPCQYAESPCLMEFDVANIDLRTFEIHVECPSGLAGAEYRVFNDDEVGDTIHKGPVPANGHLLVPVPPGQYLVEIMVPYGPLPTGLRRCRPFNPDVTETPLVVKLAPPAAAVAHWGPTSSHAISTSALVQSWTGNRLVAKDAGRHNASLLIQTNDALTQVQLFDDQNKAVLLDNDQLCQALGSVKISGLAPGAYRAVANSTLGSTERFTALSSDEQASISFPGFLPVSTPPLNSLAERLGLEATLPSVTGPGAHLAQAIRVAEKVGGDDPKMADQALLVSKNMGLEEFAAAEQEGLRIVLAVHLDAPNPTREALEQVRLSIGNLAGDAFERLPARECQVEGVATFKAVRPPGPYWLRIERRQNDATNVADFCVVVLPNRVTELIIEQSAKGPVRVSQFSPEAHPAQRVPLEFVFKLHMMERDLHDGPFERPPLLLDELLKTGVVEPICFALGVGLRSRQADTEGLAALVNQLVEVAPELPDGHVVRGLIAERADRSAEAATHYRAALERGLPILVQHLKLLLDGAARCQVDHPRLALAKTVWNRVLPGPVWTAWQPKLP